MYAVLIVPTVQLLNELCHQSQILIGLDFCINGHVRDAFQNSLITAETQVGLLIAMVLTAW